jgi:transposase-like protein
VSRFLEARGCGITKVTSWRDVQQVGAVVRKMYRKWGKVEVIGVDERMMKVKGKKVVLGFVVDAKRGETLGIEVLVQQDAFVDWLRKYAQALGARVVVIPTSRDTVRRNLTRRLKKVKGWDRDKEKLKRLVRNLPQQGGKVLLAMEKEVRDAPLLRDVVVDMMERWSALRCYHQVSGVPTTNNATERAIGRSKIRYKTIGGYKSMEGMQKGAFFTQWLYRPRSTIDLNQLLPA